jgi:hypothetical protein
MEIADSSASFVEIHWNRDSVIDIQIYPFIQCLSFSSEITLQLDTPYASASTPEHCSDSSLRIMIPDRSAVVCFSSIK